MSVVRLKIEVICEVDTEDYVVPADGKLVLSIQEDVEQALEANLSVAIDSIKVTRAGNNN